MIQYKAENKDLKHITLYKINKRPLTGGATFDHSGETFEVSDNMVWFEICIFT